VARRWTSTDDARLRRGYAGGEPVAEIAGALARSPDAVVARRALLGIAPRRVSRPWCSISPPSSGRVRRRRRAHPARRGPALTSLLLARRPRLWTGSSKRRVETPHRYACWTTASSAPD